LYDFEGVEQTSGVHGSERDVLELPSKKPKQYAMKSVTHRIQAQTEGVYCWN